MILRSMWEIKYGQWVKANIHELKRFIIFDPWLWIIAQHPQKDTYIPSWVKRQMVSFE